MLQQRKCFTELSGGVRGVDSERTPGFREFFAVGLEDEREVSVARSGELEGVLQLHLPRSALQQVSAAHHVGHFLRGVVHDHGKLIRERTIAPANNRVT